MTHHALLLHRLFCVASLIIFTLSFTSLVYAAPQRNFVSAQRGNDANATYGCPITLPCRNFNAAIGVVSMGGEVVALDSGSYGPTTINKAVTLTGPTGVYVGITAQTPGSIAIQVSAASTDTVVLRGLTLTGLGGLFGIYVTSVGNLHVESCVVGGFDGQGILVVLAADGSHIFVKDTIVRNNVGCGIQIQTFTGLVRASIDNCRSERNVCGFFAYSNSRLTINRSVASGNAEQGFSSFSAGSGTSSVLSCNECVASNNDDGFKAFAAAGGLASIMVSHSTATNNNSFGFNQFGNGVFESLGNNLVRRNAVADTLGTITVIAAQ